MTVYVIQDQQCVNKQGQLESKFDFTPAEPFGQLQFLLPPGASPFKLDPVLKTLHERLQDFKDGDYLLLTGNPVLLGIATAIAADYNNGNVQLLQWSGARHAYLPVHVRDVFAEPAK